MTQRTKAKIKHNLFVTFTFISLGLMIVAADHIGHQLQMQRLNSSSSTVR
jgi:hypothetical protein